MGTEAYFIVIILMVLIGLMLLVGFNPLGWADGFIVDLGLLEKPSTKG